MLTRIVNKSEGYKVGDIYDLWNIDYKIVEIETKGDLQRIWLEEA